jgi:molecular chaperone DnaK
LGGGTFDISVLDIGEGLFEVKATNGDTHLGGDDWDMAVMDWIIAEFKADSGIDLHGQADALQRIKEEAEKAKIALSSSQEYDINLPFITADASGPKHIQKKLTRAKLEQLTAKLRERTIGPVNACLKDAGLASKQIDELVLVGGMTRMPSIIETARKLIGKEPHKGVNPDEVVAVGAAIQGGVLKGDVQDVLLLDVTPLTLAIETAGGVATPMIPRNTTVPTKKTNIFSTYSDNQPGVEIVILQGERPLSRDNKRLGTFHLDGIPPAPRGVPQVEVTFDIDANGILHVSAKDKASGKENKVTIKANSGLNEAEIERMVKDAEANAEEDRRIAEVAQARNQADAMVHQVRKSLTEHADKIDAAEKTKIEEAIKETEAAIQSDDKARIEAASEALMTASQKIGEIMAAEMQKGDGMPGGSGGPGASGGHGGGGSGAAGGSGGGSGSSRPKDDDIVDADFKEVRRG